MSVNIFTKKAGVQISPNFNSDEFDCPCDKCDHTLIDEDLVSKLQALRDLTGASLHINSGYRCQAHQDALTASGAETAKGVSQHTLGKAADVKVEGLSGPDLEVKARDVGFMAVGVAKTWCHLDLRIDKERTWYYK